MFRVARSPSYALVGALALSTNACIARQIRSLQEQIEDSRAPDAREGVLELDPVSQTRLELLGRTSAPTRYAERTDANRMRVVAFDFGGAELGQYTDTAGNLLAFGCGYKTPLRRGAAIPPESLSSGEPAPNPAAGEDYKFYKGMFRQYSRQIGTTVESDVSIGPVGTTARFYSSHNFLVLEWRRYTLDPFEDSTPCTLPHVSAIESGIAARIIFDVRLRTIDAKMSATFGIADLAVALARSEATVEVSYELVGTVIDLLPHDAIIITSVNEYMNALKNFHAAVASLSEAWQQYNVAVDAKSPPPKRKLKIGDKEFDSGRLFKPEQLAYYIEGIGVGDTYLHLENVEVCEDIVSISDYYTARYLRLSASELDSGSIKNLKGRVAELKKQLRWQKGEERLELRKQLRVGRSEVYELEREVKVLENKLKALDLSYAENSCQKTLDEEDKRVAYVCASIKVAEEKHVSSDHKYDYIGNATCLRPEEPKSATKSATESATESARESARRTRFQSYFEAAEREIRRLMQEQQQAEGDRGKSDEPKGDKPKVDKPKGDKPRDAGGK